MAGEVFYNLMIKSQSFSGAVSLVPGFHKCVLVLPACREAKKARGLGLEKGPSPKMRSPVKVLPMENGHL